VYRSLRHIYAQVINDALRGKLQTQGNAKAAQAVGELIAQEALERGIKKVVFDRNGFLYHGRIKTLAEAARQKGLEF
jgi:large subunit ribosomal protein L18